MVCSACGYENQVGHRFCGMCGMPLPHRPLTAPGANSTLNLTRVPLANGSGLQHSAAGRTGVLTEVPGDSQVPANSDGNSSGQSTVDARNAADEALAAEQAAIPSDEPPPKELVPDLPLDEYVKSFHYEPPSDPTEITMRGDASVQEAVTPRSDASTSGAATSAMDGTAISAVSTGAPETTAPSTVAADAPPTSPPAVESKPVSDAITAAAADVESRLGLEPEAPAEARIERPRFLDINEPPAESKPASSGTSTIVGPSFLGLSDAPEVTAEPSIVSAGDAEAANRRGRLWLVAAIVVIFAGLGAMEWRAQRNQSGNGPVEIIKAKIRDLRHQNPSQANSGTAAPASTGDANGKPEMQVQDQPKPPAQDQATAAGGAATSSASSTSAASAPHTNLATPPLTAAAKTPTGSQVTAGQKSSTPPKQTSAPSDTQAAGGDNASANQTTADALKAYSSQETPQTAVEKPKPTPAAADNQEATVKQTVPGAEEMAKAKNASDSAAEAAWLWKATAKGNPDAPVQLADMYVKGSGVPRSCEQAVVLLKTAAEKENARARNRLAAMYASGNCVSRNRVEAYRWVSSALAANPNSQWAQQNRDLLWQQMSPDERAAAEKYR